MPEQTIKNSNLAYISFLENLEQIDRAIRKSTDIDHMLKSVLETVVSIFQCDRAWLLFPCNPDAPSWIVPMECTRSEYPGAMAMGVDIPMTREVQDVLYQILKSEEPMRYDPESGQTPPPDNAKQFSIQSQMVTAIHPKVGQPWVFGMHQCSYTRVWSGEEQRLFKEISRRVADSLSSLLYFQDLRASEERYKGLVANLPSAVYRCSYDPSWTMHYLSEAVETTSGYPASDFLDNRVRTYESIIHPDDREWLRARVDEAVSGNHPFSFEYRILHADGSIRWVYEIGRSICDDAGDILWLDGAIFNITERKLAQKALEAERDHSAIIIKRTPAIVCRLALDGVTKFINPAGEKITGYSAHELVGRNWWKTFYPGEEYIQVEKMMRMLDKGDVIDYEMMMTTKDGRKRTISWSSACSHDEAGAPAEIIGFGNDLTERKEAEKKKLDLERLRSAVETAGAVCHELSQPLQIISLKAEIMINGIPADDPRRSDLETFIKETRRIAGITRRLLGITSYQTKEYVGRERILDLDKSTK